MIAITWWIDCIIVWLRDAKQRYEILTKFSHETWVIATCWLIIVLVLAEVTENLTKKVIVRRICVLVVTSSLYIGVERLPSSSRFTFATYSSRTARYNVSPTSVNNFIGTRERNKTDYGEMRSSYNDESHISSRRRSNVRKNINSGTRILQKTVGSRCKAYVIYL